MNLTKLRSIEEELASSDRQTAEPNPVEILGRVIHDINGRRATLAMELVSAENRLEGLDVGRHDELSAIFANLSRVNDKLERSLEQIRQVRAALKSNHVQDPAIDGTRRIDELSTCMLLWAARLVCQPVDATDLAECAREMLLGVSNLQEIAAEELARRSESRGGFALSESHRRCAMLVVEDDIERTRMVEILSTHLKDVWVIPLEDPRIAATLLENQAEPRVDLLVADLEMMPMDGAELARRARRCRPDLGVLLIGAAEAAPGAKEKVALRRPYEPHELVDEVLIMLVPELAGST